MKKSIFWIGGISALFLFGSCVESSQKYKSLQSQMDSLQVAYKLRLLKWKGLFADLMIFHRYASIQGA